MRRYRIAILLISALSLLLGPATNPAQAQVGDISIAAVIVGNTNPQGPGPGAPPDRTAGGSSFTGTQIRAVITCSNGEVAEALLRQPAGHNVDYWSDDDVTDGFGEITATDTNRAFEAVPDDRLEVRTDNPVPSDVDIRVRIVDGDFTRVAGVVQVNLVLDIRVARVPGGVQCETRSSSYVPARAVLELLPDTDANVTSGFFIVGAVTRH